MKRAEIVKEMTSITCSSEASHTRYDSDHDKDDSLVVYACRGNKTSADRRIPLCMFSNKLSMPLFNLKFVPCSSPNQPLFFLKNCHATITSVEPTVASKSISDTDHIPNSVTQIVKSIESQSGSYKISDFNQYMLIDQIVYFCSNAKNFKGEYIFDLFDSDLETFNKEYNEFKKGICLGISALFLICNFVTNEQVSKKNFGCQEDDMNWFIKCLYLLSNDCNNSNIISRYEVSRFITLALFLQNINYTKKLDTSIFNGSNHTQYKQLTNLQNLEFDGEKILQFSDHNLLKFTKDELATLILSNRDTYLIICAIGHAGALHISDRSITFFDPNKGFFETQYFNMSNVYNFIHTCLDDFQHADRTYCCAQGIMTKNLMHKPESPSKTDPL